MCLMALTGAGRTVSTQKRASGQVNSLSSIHGTLYGIHSARHLVLQSSKIMREITMVGIAIGPQVMHSALTRTSCVRPLRKRRNPDQRKLSRKPTSRRVYDSL